MNLYIPININTSVVQSLFYIYHINIHTIYASYHLMNIFRYYIYILHCRVDWLFFNCLQTIGNWFYLQVNYLYFNGIKWTITLPIGIFFHFIYLLFIFIKDQLLSLMKLI